MAHRTTALTERINTRISVTDSPSSAVIDAVRRGARPSLPIIVRTVRPDSNEITVVSLACASARRAMKKAQ